ncbi:uncharacterized protein LOC133921626 isoform X4 [Phragmites australis]|uniref:uncharacterized protein LOC133921626 isoform X4 n=1 Tax=Phragmites australis TaxID=29695 RepID=UPI002D790527|nr:uncharacterized protein LOC133921626 isoform X4 [Phragmites australis]
MGDLGGGDWRDEAAEEQAPPAPVGGGADHLVVMVHGIVGSTADWKFGAEQFDKLLSDKVIVHCSNRNMHKLTLDGIDVMGERLAQEVPFLFGVTAIESFACCIIHLIFGRTGKHLFFTDNDDGKPPLLQCMVDDWGDLQFMSALQAFKRRVAYSNVGHDHIVGWRTSSIRRDSELPMWVDSTDKIYPHIVHEELSKAETPNQCADVYNCTIEVVHMMGLLLLKFTELLLRGLKRVSWEKVDVSFHNSKVRSAAHSVIQVKDPVMHCEGADVIQHMIDHFILE